MERGRSPKDVPEEVGEVDRVTATGVPAAQDQLGEDGVGGHPRCERAHDEPVARRSHAAGEQQARGEGEHQDVHRRVRNRDEFLRQCQILVRRIRHHQVDPGEGAGGGGDDQRIDEAADVARGDAAPDQKCQRSDDGEGADKEKGICRVRKGWPLGVPVVVARDDEVAGDQQRESAG
jgi:hypothetical protein